MNALGVVLRGLLFLAHHPATKSAFRAAFHAGAAELIRHAQGHLRSRSR